MSFDWFDAMGFDQNVCLWIMYVIGHLLWVLSAIGLVVGTACRALHRRSPASRYAVSLTGMLSMVVCVPMTMWLVEMPADAVDEASVAHDEGAPFRESVSGHGHTANTSVGRLDSSGTGSVSDEVLPGDALAGDAGSPVAEVANESPDVGARHSTELAISSAAASMPTGWRARLSRYVTCGWIAGVLCLMSRLVVAMSGGTVLRSAATKITDPNLLELVSQQAARIGLRSAPLIAVCERTVVPAVVGILRPMILIPAKLVTGLDREQLTAVISHELAHIRRYDLLVNLLQRVTEALLFFHPAIWFVSRRVSREREECCDDATVSAGCDRVEYAGTLLRMAEICRLVEPSHQLATLSAAGTNASHFARRVRRLLGSEQPPRVANRASVAMIVGLLLAVSVTAAAIQDQGVVQDDLQEQTAAHSASGVEKNAPESSLNSDISDDQPLHTDAKMAEIIAVVQKNESAYNDIETKVKRERTMDAKKWTIPRTTEAVHVIRQPNRMFADMVLTKHVGEDDKTDVSRSVSAFDGTQTTSIEYGNTVNIHHGRYEPAYVFSPHCWALFSFEVNFPLSVYLRGTAALKTHPKVRQIPRERGSVFEFYKVETEYVGEDKVGNLDCVKIRVQRWYYTNDIPVVQFLWLARERNFLCVKTQVIARLKGNTKLPAQISFVRGLREIKPGVWLPESVTTKYFNHEFLQKGELVVNGSRTLTLMHAAVSQHDDSRFKVSPPADLPVYTIKDERLVDSPRHPRHIRISRLTTLPEIIANLRKAETEYANFKLEVTDTYLKHELENSGVEDGSYATPKSTEITRSVTSSGRYSFVSEKRTPRTGGGTQTTRVLEKHDGEATRYRYESDRKQEGEFIASWSEFRLSDSVTRIMRPHMMPLRTLDLYRPLSVVLSDEWTSRRQSSKQEVVYEGDDMIDDMLCYRVCRNFLNADGSTRLSHYLWLARDRNYLPIRTQWKQPGKHATLPASMSTTTRLREIKPGVWIPWRVMSRTFDWFARTGLADDRIIHTWTHDMRVTHAAFDPQVTESDFAEVVLPAGAKFSVTDTDGTRLGTVEQKASGNMSVSADKLKELRAAARAAAPPKRQPKAKPEAAKNEAKLEQPKYERMRFDFPIVGGQGPQLIVSSDGRYEFALLGADDDKNKDKKSTRVLYHREAKLASAAAFNELVASTDYLRNGQVNRAAIPGGFGTECDITIRRFGKEHTLKLRVFNNPGPYSALMRFVNKLVDKQFKAMPTFPWQVWTKKRYEDAVAANKPVLQLFHCDFIAHELGRYGPQLPEAAALIEKHGVVCLSAKDENNGLVRTRSTDPKSPDYVDPTRDGMSLYIPKTKQSIFIHNQRAVGVLAALKAAFDPATKRKLVKAKNRAVWQKARKKLSESSYTEAKRADVHNPTILWGEPAENGLRLGISGVKNGAKFPIGQGISWNLYLRNDGGEAVKIGSGAYHNNDVWASLTAEGGKWIPLEVPRIPMILHRYRIDPNRYLPLASSRPQTILRNPDGSRATPPAEPSHFLVQPGKYKLNVQARLGELLDHAPMTEVQMERMPGIVPGLDEWIGRLSLPPIDIELTPPEVKTAKAGDTVEWSWRNRVQFEKGKILLSHYAGWPGLRATRQYRNDEGKLVTTEWAAPADEWKIKNGNGEYQVAWDVGSARFWYTDGEGIQLVKIGDKLVDGGYWPMAEAAKDLGHMPASVRKALNLIAD